MDVTNRRKISKIRVCMDLWMVVRTSTGMKSKVLDNRVVYEEKLKNKMSKKLPEVKVHHHRYPKTYNIPLTTTKKGIN